MRGAIASATAAWAILLDRSAVRPLRGHRKMSKLQGWGEAPQKSGFEALAKPSITSICIGDETDTDGCG